MKKTHYQYVHESPVLGSPIHRKPLSSTRKRDRQVAGTLGCAILVVFGALLGRHLAPTVPAPVVIQKLTVNRPAIQTKSGLVLPTDHYNDYTLAPVGSAQFAHQAQQLGLRVDELASLVKDAQRLAKEGN